MKEIKSQDKTGQSMVWGCKLYRRSAASAEGRVPLTCSHVCVCVCVHARVGCARVWGPTRSAVQALAAGHGAARPGGRQAQSPQLLSVTAPPCSLSDHELCDV